MAHIRLASFYAGHSPGDVIEVADDMVRPLWRDGRVAAVVDAPASEPAPEPEPSPSDEPEPDVAITSKRRRRAEE
ncbi:hypothetical protein GCM10010400_72830 [Streptomyces aculeolatus]|uniref:hypothetical protein n=1 Tax=Streptomyces aculeolatus TaxID=270689 RepID=UPI001CECFC7D|nr:hypothetical protein [Streptomyces aculeolatus]